LPHQFNEINMLSVIRTYRIYSQSSLD